MMPFFTLFRFLLLDLHVKTGTRFSFRDKRLFEISDVEITRVDCMSKLASVKLYLKLKLGWMVRGEGGLLIFPLFLHCHSSFP